MRENGETTFCYNHLKNISILYSFDWKSFQMAPAYDLVSTTYFARFSSTMGMAIGNHLDIREVTPEDFHIMAERIGINMRLIRNMVKEFQQRATAALNTEGNLLSEQGFEPAPYIADELQEEMLPRLEVLSKI